MHRLLVGWLTASLVMAPTAWIKAATVEVRVFDFNFSANPAGQPILDPTINLGDTIRWVWHGGLHTSTSVAGLAESWESPLSSQIGFAFEHTFTHPGVFPYYCEVHGFDNGNGTAGGMSGTITVVPAAPSADFDDDGDVDLRDLASFMVCFTGDQGAAVGECTAVDFDGNGAVGLDDYTETLAALNGP